MDVMERRRSFRWTLFGVGAASFAAAHAVLAAFWAVFEPTGVHRPWFLNSSRAVAFTAAWLFATGWFGAAAATPPSAARRTDGPGSAARGGSIAAGAVAMMVVVLAVVGPGTLFPIAIVIGGCIVAASVLVGAVAGERLRSR